MTTNKKRTRAIAGGALAATLVVLGGSFVASAEAQAAERMFADTPGVVLNTLEAGGVVPTTVWPPAPEYAPQASFDNEHGLDDDALAAGQMVAGIWGVTNIGGYATSGHVAGSDHYTGNALDIMLTPISDESIALGWEIADWLVENAEELNISYIIWNGQKWNAEYPERGWAPYSHPTGGTSSAYAHNDHIHVSFY